MGKYKVEITGIDTNKLKVLKNNETIELFKKYQKGDKLAKEEIVNGNFREDLFNRLSSFHIHLPPLWEWREDIFL